VSTHASKSSARFAHASERWTAGDGAAIAAELGLPTGSSVLDVGGGTGVLARHVAAASGCTVTVLDHDALAVETASSRSGVSAALGDAAAMPFPDASFDAALFIDAFTTSPTSGRRCARRPGFFVPEAWSLSRSAIRPTSPPSSHTRTSE